MARMAVAVSGGADSLYALLSLQEAGHDVVALHGLFLPAPTSVENTENADSEAVQGLKKLCQAHNIPLHILDFRQAFDAKVITPFIQAYAAGDTPNPCALCNAHIKFGLLMDVALSPQNQGGLGAELFATGHYADLAQQTTQKNVSPQHSPLRKGHDAHKDQSYFLSLVPRASFEKVLFPLAKTHKSDNIAYLQQKNVTIPVPKESQEICFIPADAYRDFVYHEARKRRIALGKKGPIYVLENGEELPLPAKFGDTSTSQAQWPHKKKRIKHTQSICQHAGLWQYTEGQRRGLGIAWKEPLYVQAKDQERNALILSNKTHCILKSCRVEQLNFFVDPQCWPQEIFAKVRHRQHEAPARVTLLNSTSASKLTSTPHENTYSKNNVLHIVFLEEQSPTAPGQIAALYDAQGQVLCGGIITEVSKNSTL